MTQAVNFQDLDEHLMDVVQALHGAVRRGISRLNDSGGAERSIRDCREILDEVLAGKTAEWLTRAGG